MDEKAQNPTGSKMELVQTATAEMPGVEEIARAIAQADEQNGGPPYEQILAMGKHAREPLFDRARAILALFAPILAENRQLKLEVAEKEETSRISIYGWRDKANEMEAALSAEQEKAHYANGVADLAMKHRAAAEAALAAERERGWTEAYRYKGKSYQYREERRVVDVEPGETAAIRGEGGVDG